MISKHRQAIIAETEYGPVWMQCQLDGQINISELLIQEAVDRVTHRIHLTSVRLAERLDDFLRERLAEGDHEVAVQILRLLQDLSDDAQALTAWAASAVARHLPQQLGSLEEMFDSVAEAAGLTADATARRLILSSLAASSIKSVLPGFEESEFLDLNRAPGTSRTETPSVSGGELPPIPIHHRRSPQGNDCRHDRSVISNEIARRLT